MSNTFLPINSGFYFASKDFWKTTYHKSEELEKNPTYIYYFELGNKKCMYDTGYCKYFKEESSYFSIFYYFHHYSREVDMSNIDFVFIN
jgi:hypothetical protein